MLHDVLVTCYGCTMRLCKRGASLLEIEDEGKDTMSCIIFPDADYDIGENAWNERKSAS